MKYYPILRTRQTQYPGAIDVWILNFAHAEQLFDYGSNIRKIFTLQKL